MSFPPTKTIQGVHRTSWSSVLETGVAEYQSSPSRTFVLVQTSALAWCFHDATNISQEESFQTNFAHQWRGPQKTTIQILAQKDKATNHYNGNWAWAHNLPTRHQQPTCSVTESGMRGLFSEASLQVTILHIITHNYKWKQRSIISVSYTEKEVRSIPEKRQLKISAC